MYGDKTYIKIGANVMKKIGVLLIGALFLIGVVACSGNDNNDTVEKPESEENMEQETDVEEGEVDSSEEEEVESDENDTEETKEQSTESTSIPEEIKEFEEVDIISDEIDLNDKEIKVETDNPNKRVILFIDNNDQAKKYKSIFIKKENRLKIINEGDDGLIYDEKI